MKLKLSKSHQKKFDQLLIDLGKEIKEVRTKEDLSQTALSVEPYPINQKDISEIENGLTNITLQKLFILSIKMKKKLVIEFI